MEQNNFEKHVQQKMDELKISPSESAWLNIEKRIAKDGKQRKIAFILFFLCLFLLTGGYWLFNNSGKNIKKTQNNYSSQAIKNNSKKVTGKKKDSSFNQIVISEKPHTGTLHYKIPEIASVSNREKDTKAATFKLSKRRLMEAQIKNRVSSKEETDIAQSKEEGVNEKTEMNSVADEKKEVAKNGDKKIIELKKTFDEKPEKDSIKSIGLLEKNIEKNDSAVSTKKPEIPVVKNQKRKWEFGITFSGGISFLANGFLDINNNNNSYMTAPNSGNSGGYTFPSSLPANTRSSLGFFGGVFFEKNISEERKIYLGINYKYFSTVTKTGSRIDSAVTAYNSIAYTNNYRNNFNYLEFPVLLKFKLNNNKSLPLYWQAGINISQLISSNALQFKNNTGVYYIDNSLFNKTQLGFSTGLFATLFSKQKNQVNIGPYFYYSASKLANEGLYNKKHFSFIGISTEILFKKK